MLADAIKSIEQLPDMIQKVSESIRRALDEWCEVMSKIDITETLIRLKGEIRDYYSENKEEGRWK